MSEPESKPDKPDLARCPQCGKERPWEGNLYRPFCSKRCKLIDLGAWIDEAYIIGKSQDDLS